MIKYQLITKSSQETERLASILARNLKGGEVIGLIGDLGGGKTTFVKGLALGLGIEEEILSPTFLLFKQYQTSKIILNHFDFYRIENIGEVLDIGFEEFIRHPQAVSVIEWADRVGRLLPEEKLIIKFDFIDENKRKLIFGGFGKKYKALISKLKKINYD